uniref:stage II sporulation protein M n=1 Tax=Vulcanisaeta sp. JCM 14467 TaxID=1295370 RepID=UPI00210F42E0|nr:stage II sporulation protein M [Vulcanisaeta sp. JCM 14467]
MGWCCGWCFAGLRLFSCVCLHAVYDVSPLGLLLIIIIRNASFALVVFLVSYSLFIAYFVLFVEGLYVGFSVSFTVRSLMALILLLPHGVIELLGYSLFALAGVKYHSGDVGYLRLLVLGIAAIVVAAFVEAFISPSVARYLFGRALCGVVI